jgi:hypothetical protein
MLLVCERYALARDLLDPACYAFVPDAEMEQFRRGTWIIAKRELPLPRLADPALVRDFLDVSGTFAARIRIVERDPHPASEQHRGDTQNEQ